MTTTTDDGERRFRRTEASPGCSGGRRWSSGPRRTYLARFCFLGWREEETAVTGRLGGYLVGDEADDGNAVVKL